MWRELAPLSPEERYILLAIIVGLMAFVLFFELKVMRSKTKEVRKASIKKDEAYNTVLTTRSVLNAMQRQGKGTGSAEQLLSAGKQAMQSGQYDRCIELCAEAREELIKPKERKVRAVPSPATKEGEREALEEVAESILSSSEEPEPEEVSGAEEYKGAKLPADKDGNYLAAKFEIQTAKADIKRALDKGRETAEAQNLMTDAESEFVAGNYTKALSLAVRARRATSAEAASEGIRLKSAPMPAKPGPRPAVVGAAGMCHACGEALEADDGFCSKCGARVPRERMCASCGTKPRPTDTFCRKCGSKID
ncbi:MAG: hypothetical protein A3K67_02045 [Euryarchaeota archaeon RBG_16_62_10]|nr:MAG: hypothetical protein A3K67_02045 [Euryarchaeota archaeon RBG_16_62_10]